MHLLQHVGEVLEPCVVCRAFDRAHHVPAAGTSTVSVFNEKLKVDLLLLGDIIAFHFADILSKRSLLASARPKSPQEMRDASANLWIGIFGPPKGTQTDDGRERGNEVWTDFCAERKIKLLL